MLPLSKSCSSVESTPSAIRLQVAGALRTITHLLASDAALTPALDELHWMFGGSVADASVNQEVGADAGAPLPHDCLAREGNEAVALSVREYMVQSLKRDPPTHGLLHAAIAAVLCDGCCSAEAASALGNGVQPCADSVEYASLRSEVTQACARTASLDSGLCKCRSRLLQRLVNGPRWQDILARPSGECFVVAAHTQGQSRRWVLAARLDVRQLSATRRSVGCALYAEPFTVDGYFEEDQASMKVLIRADRDAQSVDLVMQDGLMRSCLPAIEKLSAAAQAWVHEPEGYRSGRGIGLSGARDDIPPLSMLSKVAEVQLESGEVGLAPFSGGHLVSLGYDSRYGIWYFVACQEGS